LASTLERFRLDGKVAIVTGADGFIGSVYTRTFLEAGAHVVGLSIRSEELTRLAAALDTDRFRPILCDITDEDAVDSMAREVLGALPGVDVIMNNAAVGSRAAESLDLPAKDWRTQYELCVLAPVMISQRFLPSMQERGAGSIINIGSLAAQQPYPRAAAYGAAKAALHTLTLYMAFEWGQHNIRANMLIPSLMASPENQANRHLYAERGLLERAVLGRYGDPEEMAGPALFLASDASSHVTGQCLVSGGDVFPGLARVPGR
jgi:NAD(P)-dependent dehydrogenase (short-subunit alcohol dehydrogenase family)